MYDFWTIVIAAGAQYGAALVGDFLPLLRVVMGLSLALAVASGIIYTVGLFLRQ